MKGYIVLTEVRSGSNWLTSLASSTGTMGNSGEWLGFERLPKPYYRYKPDELYAYIMQKACTENGRFAIKIFPRHIQSVQRNFGFDFVLKCLKEHDVKIVVLTRQDRLGQAISSIRARQTGQWRSTIKTGKASDYDYHGICERYFNLGVSNAFWQDYLNINNIPHEIIVYEDLLSDPAPFLSSLATFLDVAQPENWQSKLTIQRDKTTDDWKTRFNAEFAQKGIVHGYAKKSWKRFPRSRLRFEIRHFLRFKVFWWL